MVPSIIVRFYKVNVVTLHHLQGVLEQPSPTEAPQSTETPEGPPPRAPCNATSAPAHKCDRADTTKHCTHSRPPNTAPRWEKLTRQEIPSQRHAARAGGPHHALALKQTHHNCNCSPGRPANQLSHHHRCTTTTTQPIQMPVTTHPKREHNPSCHPLACRIDPSWTRQPVEQHAAKATNHPPDASSHSPPIHETETRASQVTGPGQPITAD
ncbi:hypothetical protein CRENBAI_010033 [Crenichthys baileyi]|uniref:Uncharacterized protein n=1 Tax=Crenichthys baileyi TaxID=28760 RepID=A0AAV9RUF9_9TELE